MESLTRSTPRMLAAAAISIATLLPAAARASQAPAAPRVQLPHGEIEGLHLRASGTDLRAFRGIPYAAPPTGSYRWRAPQPIPRWAGVRQATQFAPRCMQHSQDTTSFRSKAMSEDCLYLNVWSPARDGNAKLPVLVYFHGGGFQAGDASKARYDGANLASRGIVMVTVNYRLGVFGFLAHPDAARESSHRSAGNYGLLDQHAALRWVRENIERFGGDPSKVTIGGMSAGAISVSAHMASPLSKGLFARAIGESGAAFEPIKPWRRGEADTAATLFSEHMRAPTLEALRAIPAQALLEATGPADKPRFPFWPHIDGYFLDVAPESVFRHGMQAKVPLLVGVNSHERPLSMLLEHEAPTPDNWRFAIGSLFRDHASEALTHYPGNDPDQVTRSGLALASDLFVGHSVWQWMNLHRTTSDAPIYFYRYTHPHPGRGSADRTDGQPRAKGAEHGVEVEYALGNLDNEPGYAWTPDDRKVATMFSGYIERFVKTGDPNRLNEGSGAGSIDSDGALSGLTLPRWPSVRERTDGIARQSIGASTVTESVNDAARHAFMQRFFEERLIGD
jgi:para-nitrobenzyl esterase